MAFSNDASRASATNRTSLDVDLSSSDGDWPQEQQHGRDWKKLVLVIGLGTLSWVATYIGMLELIEANIGDLPLIHKAVIGFSVAMLMTMIVWLLDQMFAPIPPLTRLAYIGGYVFLTIISVGFGFGFYWKVLESRSESSRSAESAVTQVQSALHAASTRMTQLSVTLEQLNKVSTEKAETERVQGTSCPNSRPGDGPRRKLRDEDAQRFAFAAEFVKTRVGAVNADLAALGGELTKVVGDDKSIVDKATGTRNEFMKGLGRKLDMTVTGFNAFRTDPQLKQIRADLAERAEKTVFPDTRGGTFACPDTQLQQALKGAVRAIDQLPDLEKPKIAAVEGSEATIEAFRRLTATFYGALAFKLPPSPDELRDLQKRAVQSVEASPAVAATLSSEPVVGLSKRDYIPLAIALFVDLCLLLVSMGRPMNRLHGLVPKMRAAERGPVIQILSRFNEIHRDDEIRRNFEVFRHVVFDFHGAYYVAVPLDAPYRPSGAYTKGYSTEDIEDLTHEAHLLVNLFTSFEKERIFSRVYSPFLTTRAVKKKLLRQGSKFAHADAFRIYRFRDGAWSEIILGAVMGAAKRVEAEKRKRKLEQQLFDRREPTLATPDASIATPSHLTDAKTAPQPELKAHDSPLAAVHTDTAESGLTIATATVAGGNTPRAGFLSRRRAAAQTTTPSMQSVEPLLSRTPRPRPEPTPTSAPTAAPDPTTIAEFGPYADRASREIAEERYRATLPTLRGEDGILDRPRRRHRDNRSRTPSSDDDIPAGEVVLFALPGQPSNTTTAESSRGAQPDVEHAAMVASPPAVLNQGTDEPRIGVVLRRETAEFSLPVTQAFLPGAAVEAGLRRLDADHASANASTPDLDIHVEQISRRFHPAAE